MGYNANLKVKHGVPPVGSCGASGSVVGRCITTEFEWSVVQKKVRSSGRTVSEDEGEGGREEGGKESDGVTRPDYPNLARQIFSPLKW